MPILIFLCTRKLSTCTGVSFIVSFKLEACNVKRSSSHKTLKNSAIKGKTRMGWLYGMKVHIVINQYEEIIIFYISAGNVADNNELVLFKMTKNSVSNFIGDKGYIISARCFEKLYEKGIHLITKIRENRENKLMNLCDKLLLSKRGIIECGRYIERTFANGTYSA